MRGARAPRRPSRRLDESREVLTPVDHGTRLYASTQLGHSPLDMVDHLVAVVVRGHHEMASLVAVRVEPVVTNDVAIQGVIERVDHHHVSILQAPACRLQRDDAGPRQLQHPRALDEHRRHRRRQRPVACRKRLTPTKQR